MQLSLRNKKSFGKQAKAWPLYQNFPHFPMMRNDYFHNSSKFSELHKKLVVSLFLSMEIFSIRTYFLKDEKLKIHK